MKLLIPKERAIQILQDRIADLHAHEFNAEAWRERTVLDLKEIFPLGSTQYIKIQFLRFDTFITADKYKVMLEAQKTAEEILKSYIEFINEYSKVAEEKKVIVEKDYEAKYYELLKERNGVVTEYNELLKNYEEQLDMSSELLDEKEELVNQMSTIRKNTIQLDNVSFTKLCKAFFNLPFWQIIATISVIATIIIGIFKLGNIYQENADNNEIYDFKTENTRLKAEKDSTNNVIFEKEKEIKEMQKKVDSLKSKPKNKSTTHNSGLAQ